MKIKIGLIISLLAVLGFFCPLDVSAAGGDSIWSMVRDDGYKPTYPLSGTGVNAAVDPSNGYLYSCGVTSNLTKWGVEMRNTTSGDWIEMIEEGPVGTSGPFAIAFHDESGVPYVYSGGYAGSAMNKSQWAIKKNVALYAPTIWTRSVTLATSCVSTVYDLAVNNHGVFAIGYRTNDNDGSCGSKTASWRVEKLDLNGNLLWEADSNRKGIDSRETTYVDGEDTPYSIVTDGDYIYVAGKENDASSLKARLEKRNQSNGDLQWVLTFPETTYKCMGEKCDLAISPDGETLYWTVHKPGANPDTDPMYTVLLKVTSLSSSSPSVTVIKDFALDKFSARDIVADPDGSGNIFVVGDSKHPTDSSRKNYWTVEKLDSLGNALWIKLGYDTYFTYASSTEGNLVANNLDIDSTGLYVVGRKNYTYKNLAFDTYDPGSTKGAWRIEKLDKSNALEVTLTTDPLGSVIENHPFKALVATNIGAPSQVQFALDEYPDVNGLPPATGWTTWYDWGISSENWDAVNKAWNNQKFTNPGATRKVWVRVKDSKGNYYIANALLAVNLATIEATANATPNPVPNSGTNVVIAATINSGTASGPFNYDCDCGLGSGYNQPSGPISDLSYAFNCIGYTEQKEAKIKITSLDGGFTEIPITIYFGEASTPPDSSGGTGWREIKVQE